MALVLSHSFNILHAVPRHKFCDAFVRANDSSSEIPIHRIILAAASKRLSKMFDTHSDVDSRYEVPDVVTIDTLAKIIDLIYTGEVALESQDDYAKFCVALVVLQIDIGKVVVKGLEGKDRNESTETTKQFEIPQMDSNSISAPLQIKSTVQNEESISTTIKGIKRKCEESDIPDIIENSNEDIAYANLFEDHKPGLHFDTSYAIKIPETRTNNHSYNHQLNISATQSEMSSHLDQCPPSILPSSNTEEYIKQNLNDTVDATNINTTIVSPQYQPSPCSNPGLTRDIVKGRCYEFLISLLKFASNRSASAERCMKILVQGLIDGQIEPESFLVKLQMKKTQLMAPFLKLSLPYLQYSLARRELSIPGTIPPLHMISQLGYLPPDIMLGSPIYIPRIKLQDGIKVTQTSPSIKSQVTASGGEETLHIEKQPELGRPNQSGPLIGPIRIHPVGSRPVLPTSVAGQSPIRSVATTGRVATRTPSRSSLGSATVKPNPMLMPVRSKLRPPVTSNQTRMPIRNVLSGIQQSSVTVRTKTGLVTRYIPFKYPAPPRSVLSPVTLNSPAPQYSAPAHYLYKPPVQQYQSVLSANTHLSCQPSRAPQPQTAMIQGRNSEEAYHIIKTFEINNNTRGRKRRGGQ